MAGKPSGNTISMFGKTMIDGVKKESTVLTAADVANAVPTDPAHCAVAESLRRTKGISEISVGATKVYVTYVSDPNTIVRYDISANDRALIREFDIQGAFPCGYRVTLLPPPPSRQIGARAGGAQGSNKRSGKGNNAAHRAGRGQPTRHVAAPA